MAINLRAEKPGMESAARNMEKGVQNFRNSVQQVSKTANSLGSMWKGDSHDAFIKEQVEMVRYCEELARLVDETIASLRESVKVYTQTDAECAKLLKSV